MKKIFEELIARAKQIENKCQKSPIETIENPTTDEILLEGRYYHVLQY